MPNTYITTKSHMNQVWDENGIRKAVTILKTEPGVIVQIKTEETDGYKAIVVGFGSQKESRIKAPQLKSFKKIGLKSFPAMTREIKVETPEDFKVGDTITAEEIFSIGDIVNSQGITKGRGFTGVIKRWGFHGGPRTHGQSDRERAPGSIGQGTDPGRVHRGKKMPGHYGNEIKTIKNLIIANITDDQIWVTGPVPGSIHSKIMLTKVGEKKNYVGLLGLDESDSTPKEEVVDKVKSDKSVEAKQENKEPVKDQKEDSKNESEDKKE